MDTTITDRCGWRLSKWSETQGDCSFYTLSVSCLIEVKAILAAVQKRLEECTAIFIMYMV